MTPGTHWTTAILVCAFLTGRDRCWEIHSPSNISALSKDLILEVLNEPPGSNLQLFRGTQALNSFPVTADGNKTTTSIPCAYLTHGGSYSVLLSTGLERKIIDVLWPQSTLSLSPEDIQTFPDLPVVGILQFAHTDCNPLPSLELPEFWLKLAFCGFSPDGCRNLTQSQVLFERQVRGYPQQLRLPLQCNLFGIAGYYALMLTTTTEPGVQLAQPSIIKVTWSDKFVFNVHAHSIFPCDDGISVLFQYPSCILPAGDRVRVYARLRSDVASLSPPSTLRYAAESRVMRGSHTLRFPCALFSERYVEYCFAYVSQAITGAVSNVRVDCVPTLSVGRDGAGGWSDWSPWTQCSSTCRGGFRNRYRLCDNPPPLYGSKYCQGKALETQTCGDEQTWDCPRTATLPGVQRYLGHECRCGCIVSLNNDSPNVLLETSSTSCPGRTFWLIQAEDNHNVNLILENIWLTCPSQWLKVRDGDSLSGILLAEISGQHMEPLHIESSDQYLLVEFFSEMPVAPVPCIGSFIARAHQKSQFHNTSSINSDVLMAPEMQVNMSHIAVLIFVSLVVASSAVLGVQYMHRYHRFKLISGRASPVTSTHTLLSEIITMHKVGKHKHHEIMQEEDEYETIEDEKSKVNDYEYVAGEDTANTTSELGSTSTIEQGHSVNSCSKVSKSESRKLSASPASSTKTLVNVSSAKAKKDQHNRECLLAGSEFSLPGPEHDLELDYYDYNVTNAGGVPGSLLGMDPAYLLWIPPFTPGDWEKEGSEILSVSEKYEHELHELSSNDDYYTSVIDNEKWESVFSEKETLQFNYCEPSKKVQSARIKVLNVKEDVPLHEFPSKLKLQKNEIGEKEKEEEKSPSIGHGSLDDIRFADDEGEDEIQDEKVPHSVISDSYTHIHT